MAWRPYENLIDGELDNRTPGKVTGWMRFYRNGRLPLQVSFDLTGDFHEDIRGKVIRLKNETPSDRNIDLDRKGTYMDGFAPVQRGTAGDITAGLSLGPWTQKIADQLMAQNEFFWDERGFQGKEREQRREEFAECYRKHIAQGDLYFPYVDFPYIEWYGETNGRIVLELDPSQIEIVGNEKSTQKEDKTPQELIQNRKLRERDFATFLADAVNKLSEENVREGGNDDITAIVVG